jgi:hypothetical protein
MIPIVSRGDVILDWNATIRAVVQADIPTANPGWSTRTMAMANGAMYDSFQAVKKRYRRLGAHPSLSGVAARRL